MLSGNEKYFLNIENLFIDLGIYGDYNENSFLNLIVGSCVNCVNYIKKYLLVFFLFGKFFF